MTSTVTIYPTGDVAESDVDALVEFDQAGAGSVRILTWTGRGSTADDIESVTLSGPDDVAVASVVEIAEASGVWKAEDPTEEVVIVAFTVTGTTNRDRQQRLMDTLPKPSTTKAITSYWIAEDDRWDRSDCDSAVFIPGFAEGRALSQEDAKALLESEIGVTKRLTGAQPHDEPSERTGLLGAVSILQFLDDLKTAEDNPADGTSRLDTLLDEVGERDADAAELAALRDLADLVAHALDA